MPQINASTPARVTATTSVTTITTAAFNPPANCAIVAIASFDGAAGADPQLTASNNGAALTWQPIARRNGVDSGGQPGVVEARVTYLTAARTGMTVTITSSIGNEGSLKVYVLTAVDAATPLGNVIEGSSTANPFTTTALTSAKANSIGFIGYMDGANLAANPTSSDTTFDGYFVSGSHIGGSGYKTLGALGSTATFQIDPPGTAAGTANWIAFEIEDVGVTQQGAVSLSATSTLSVNAQPPTKIGAVSLSAVSSLSANGTTAPIITASINLSVASSLSVTARLTATAAISLPSSATLAVNGRITLFAARVSLTALATFTAGFPRQTMVASVQMTITADLVLEGRRSRGDTIFTRYPRPAPEHPFRIIVQEVLTGQFVEWDLPVQDDFSYTRQLSGPTVMNGSFRPELISVQELNLDGYAYWFHVEIDEEIRASAIFMPPQYEEQGLTFACEGFAAVPHYTTWETTLSVVNFDVFSIVRSIWNHVQAHPRSKYNVVVSNANSGKTVGTDGTSTIQTERTNAARAIANRLDGGGSIFEDWSWVGAPKEAVTHRAYLISEFKKSVPVSNNFTLGPKAIEWLEAYADANPILEAEPYELQWWEAPNCGEQIDELAQQTPFDYRERVAWNATKTDVTRNLDLGYPRIGSIRSNLVFDDDNIIEVVPVQEDEDSYASEIIVIGAGEGLSTIRGFASDPFDKRVRKTYVYTDKKITTKQRADAVAKAELERRRGRRFEVEEIVVRPYHTNAPFGSYDVGDDIFVRVEVPWLNYPYGSWYRITSISVQPAIDDVRLTLVRSDSYIQPPV